MARRLGGKKFAFAVRFYICCIVLSILGLEEFVVGVYIDITGSANPDRPRDGFETPAFPLWYQVSFGGKRMG